MSRKYSKQVWLILIFIASLSIFSFAAEQQESAPSTAGDTSATAQAEQSFEQLLKKANAGDADAQFHLGVAYANGRGVPQDYKEALKWFIKAAEQGDVEAQFNLGVMYSKGKGVPQDDKEAVKWYTKAAEQGYAEARQNLGVMYAKGVGVPQDYKEAVKWFTKAGEQGLVGAQFNLGVMYRKGQGVPQDDKEAAKWYTKAAEQGYAEAQFFLGLRYSLGQGVPQDYKEAAKWLIEAAEQGHAGAQLCLGAMYNTGKGVSQNYKEAVKWYTKAAEQGLADAQYDLGVSYAQGQGVQQDYKEAIKWYTKAAEQGHAEAQCNLGVMYVLGQGVIEDNIEAYKWLLLAGVNDQDVAKAKAILKEEMTPSQIADAQTRAKGFVARKEKISGEASGDKSKGSSKGFGTGFFISQDGLFLTAAHVVENAGGITIYSQQGKYTAKTIFVDTALDIAVLKVQDGSLLQALPIASSSTVKTGEAVFTLGFPQVQLQGVEPKYTDGSVSSLSGIGNDPKFFQISVPVQPGNSGGPLLNSQGQVVGLITARLDDINTLIETGSIPQNVNYALKSSFILPLLESLPGVKDQLEKPANLDKPAAIEKAKNAVGLVVCME